MIKTRWKTAVAGALLGLALHFASATSSIAAITNAAGLSPSPPLDRQAAQDQENAWYEHVEAEAKAGRGRVQVPPLIVMIDGSDSYKRELAAQLLSVIGKDADEAVPSLVRHINDPDFFPRLRCIEALGDIGPAAAASVAVPDLIKALEDPTWQIGNMAAGSLGAMGPKAQQAVPGLEAILQRPKNSDRYASFSVTCRVALAHITGKPGLQVTALLSMLNEKDDDLNENWPAYEATLGLGELMPASKIALPDICQELINPKILFTAREEAAKDLGIFRDPQAIPFLQKAINDDPNVSVRNAAIDALEKISGTKFNIPELRKESQAKEYAKMRPWWNPFK